MFFVVFLYAAYKLRKSLIHRRGYTVLCAVAGDSAVKQGYLGLALVDEHILCHGGIIGGKAGLESRKLFEHVLPKVDARDGLADCAALRPNGLYELDALLGVKKLADLEPEQ